MILAALSNRAKLEAFFSQAEARLIELEGLIDAGYERLAGNRMASAWEGIEALEVEREEIILRTEEAFAMIEYQQDACDGGDRDYYEAVYEPNLNARAPLPHGWEWPRYAFDRELTPEERRAQGWPDSREESRQAWGSSRYRFGERVAS